MRTGDLEQGVIVLESAAKRKIAWRGQRLGAATTTRHESPRNKAAPDESSFWAS
jgi:hypothetical protein